MNDTAHEKLNGALSDDHQADGHGEPSNNGPIKVDNDGSSGLSTARRDYLLDYIANLIDRLGIITPAIMILESSKPFSFITSNMAVGITPLISIFKSENRMDEIVLLLEDSNNIDILVDKLEEMDIKRRQEEKIKKRKSTKER